MSRKLPLLSIGAALAVAWLTTPIRAADVFWTAGTANYNVGTNWSTGSLPSAFNDDRAIIDNGGTAFITDPFLPADPTAAIMGLNAGGSGTLEIRSGGNMTIQPGTIGNGGITAGVAGTGTFRLLPGGTAFLLGPLVSGNNAANTIVLGGVAAGTATINAASATFGGTTQVFKNAQLLTNGGNITLGATSVYVPVIDAGANGAALVDAFTGTVALGGALRPSFSFTPAIGANWNLFHGASITGAFAAVQGTGLGPGQRLIPSVIGTTGDQTLRITVDQALSLTVNRNARSISIANPGAAPLSFDGYAIQSPQGNLNRAAWSSLDDQNALGGDWLESTGSNNTRLSELKPTAAGTMNGATSISLGAAFLPNLASPPPFGTQSDDVTFAYAKPDGTVVAGDVNYVGIRDINNIVLQIDPVDGKARMKNTSTYTVGIDGYSITSAAGSLNRTGWTSFDDQNISDWLESTGSSANKLAELKPTSATSMVGGVSTVSMGNMFAVGGARDVVFQFLLAGQSTPATGVVAYESYPTGNADFDSDGDVDGADFLRWQRNLGATGAAATLANGNANGDGVINALDLDVWKDQFGNVRPAAVAAAAAVPEPGIWLLGMMALMSGLFLLRSETRARQLAASPELAMLGHMRRSCLNEVRERPFVR